MSGIATTQMAVLEALKSGDAIALDVLDAKLEFERRFIVNSTVRLIYSGLIERAEIGVYRITQAGLDHLVSGEPLKSGKTGSRPGYRRKNQKSLRQRLWNAMRGHAAGEICKAFSLPDLLTLSLEDGEESQAAYNNAQQYVRCLKKTGYLLTLTQRQQGTRPGSNGFQRYKLKRDTGDTAPVVRQSDKSVFDPNTREVFTW